MNPDESRTPLLARVRQILRAPAETWPTIAQEPATVGSICRQYLVWLALIPALAGFISASIIGYASLGFGGRLGVGTGLVQLVAGVLLTLIGIYLISLVVNWLAPKFDGQPDPVAAYKLVAYGSTAGLAGGIFALVPWLGILGLLAALYSIYLVYLGLPVLMKNPPQRTLVYTLAVVVCAFIVNLIMAAIAGWLLPAAALPGNTAISAAQTDAGPSAARLEELGRRIEEMGQRIESASRSGDPNAAAQASRDALGELAKETGARTPLAASKLKALLPTSVAGMERTDYQAESRSMLGLSMSTARADYAGSGRSLKLQIIDTGSAAGLLAGVASWANMLVDRESASETERTWRDGERVISERADKDGATAEYRILLPNGIVIDATARGMKLEELERLVTGLDLATLEASR